MPFALNNPVAGPTLSLTDCDPFLRDDQPRAEMQAEIVRSIECIPAYLLSASTTFGFDTPGWDKVMLTTGLTFTNPYMANEHWAHLRIFFGILLHSTGQRKFVLDSTPRRKCDSGRLWCEVDHAVPASTGQASPFLLEVVLDEDTYRLGRKVRRLRFLARFDSAPIRAVMRKHEAHERTLCNVARRGEALLARLALRKREADDIIADQR
jgi:hypothetical protein